MTKTHAWIAMVALVAAALPLLDCAPLQAIAATTCGNAVVDAAEDCDGFAPGGQVCGRPDEGARACRFTCDPAKPGGACPDGWGCGTSGVCREPTGRFAAPSARAESGVVGIAMGDFDGDHRADVLATADRGADNAARTRVVYFDGNASVAAVTAFPAPLISPAIRDLDRDGRADLAFGLAGGVNVATGRVDRTFSPILFPTLTIRRTEGLAFFPVRGTKRALPSGRSEGRLVAGTYRPEQAPEARLLTSLEAGAGGYGALLPGPASSIVGRGAWGDLFKADPQSTCGEVVFAMRTTPPVLVVASPCKPDPDPLRSRWADRAVTVIPLPEAPTRGAVLADWDADGNVDVLVTGETKTYLLRNEGTGFAKLIREAKEPSVLNQKPLFDVDGVLGAGDFNQDGFPDYLIPRGVLYSFKFANLGPDGGVGDVAFPNGQASYVFLPSSRSPRWSSVVVGQINADAYLDYVAASEGAADVELGSGVPGGVVTSTVSTPGVVTSLGLGDLDGDTIGDLVLSTRQADDTSELAIAFGRALGPPEAARSIGRVGNDSTLDVGSSFHLANEVVVLTPTPTPGAPPGYVDVDLSIVLPSGDRQLLAPLLHPNPDKEEENLQGYRPHSVLVAPFAEKERLDLFSLAIGVRKLDSTLADRTRQPAPLSLWRSASTGPLSFPPFAKAPVDVAASPASYTGRDTLLLQTTSGDLDRPANGVEEAVVLTPGAGGVATVLSIRLGQAAGASGAYPLPGLQVGTKSMIVLGDVDGDGALDAIALVSDAAGSKVAVLWGDGKGGFDATPLVLPVPAEGGADTSVTGFAVVLTGGAPASRDLVLTTSRRILRLPIGRGTRTLPVPETLAAGFEGLTSIGAGDVDGDGVEDLAIAEKGTVRVLRQIARLP